jgi:hypothetical protein
MLRVYRDEVYPQWLTFWGDHVDQVVLAFALQILWTKIAEHSKENIQMFLRRNIQVVFTLM